MKASEAGSREARMSLYPVNLGEQAMREHVILRKIIGCFRSENGAENYQYIAPLIASWTVQGKNGFVEHEGLLRKELCMS